MTQSIAISRLRIAVHRSHLSHGELCRKLCISGTYLSYLIEGRVSISPYVAVRLERTLGIDAQKLLLDQLLDQIEEARKEYRTIQDNGS